MQGAAATGTSIWCDSASSFVFLEVGAFLFQWRGRLAPRPPLVPTGGQVLALRVLSHFGHGFWESALVFARVVAITTRAHTQV